MKIISAGIIVHHNHKMLACVPFGSKHGYDIPKGQVEENETFIQTAMRELKEETGIIASRSQLKDLGKFQYMPTKDLYLFSLDFKFNTFECRCMSTFDFHGKQVPEIIGFKEVDFSDINLYYKSLQPVLIKALELI